MKDETVVGSARIDLRGIFQAPVRSLKFGCRRQFGPQPRSRPAPVTVGAETLPLFRCREACELSRTLLNLRACLVDKVKSLDTVRLAWSLD